MKRYINSLAVLLLACFIGTSCTDEDAVNGKSKYESGIPVSLSLSFKPDVPDVVTKAGENMDDYKDDVYDITIFAFAENGKVNGIQTYQNENGEKLGTKSGTVTNFSTLSGVNYIYAVANAQTYYYQGLIDQLKGCKDRSDFLTQVATLQQKSIDLVDGRFLMSGVFGPKNIGTETVDLEASKVDIAPEVTKLSGEIKLSRVASSITFNIKVGENSDCTAFTPKSWKVVDVPAVSYLFDQGHDYIGKAGEEGKYYFDSDSALFNQNQTSITFYMTENRKNAAKVDSYLDRMKERPERATYLQLTGVYSGKANKYDENNKKVTDDKVTSEAYVTYYIPLGSATNLTSVTNLGNYETKRNTQYIYNVFVNGVKDIVVEVIEGKETSVAGGDVIYRSDDGASYKLLDAHYEARVLTFKLSDITNKVKLIYGVKTPYTNGYQYDKDAKDIDWVKFLVHTDGKESIKDYPGDNSKEFLTVEELMNKMIEAKSAGKEQTLFNVSKGEDKLLYVTAFIDEYYYENKDWKTFVNKPNREMLLLCTTKNGFDSSVTDATFVLSQRSIQTYYTLDEKAGNIIAVGLEWANETPIRNNAEGIGATSSKNQNGRANMLSNLSGKSWSNVPTMTKDYLVSNTDDNDHFTNGGITLGMANLSPFTACMSRNRSSDGKNKIDESDVKWFLPSIEQYQYMVLGQSGYDQGAYLYPSGRDKSKEENRLHFYSSSVNTDGRNILWAEEGMSTSTNDEYPKDPSNYWQRRHSIRCIRYLGKLEGSETSIVKKDTYRENNVSYDVVRTTYLNNNSIRGSKNSSSLTKHNELEENNKPYEAFAIAKGDIEYNNSCLRGWRIPNQREMSLMYSLYGIGANDASKRYITSTEFSGFPSRMFILSKGGMGVGYISDIPHGMRNYIRCVRDVD